VSQEAPYDVEIVFTGICTFVNSVDPAITEKDPTKRGPITVVVMNARDVRPKRGGDPEDLHGHVPYILSAGTYFRVADNPNIKLKNAQNEPGKFQYTELEGETIEVDRANIAGLNGKLLYTVGGGECPTESNKTSMHWLPSLRNVTRDSGLRRNDDYFSTSPSPRFVAGQMILDEGILETKLINLRKWAFKIKTSDATSTVSQAIAQEAVLSLKAVGDPFVLNLRSFDRTKTRSLLFHPSNGKVVIVIGNTKEEETGPMPGTNPTQSKDQHFLLYYEFVQCNPHATSPMPFKAVGGECLVGQSLPVWSRNPVGADDTLDVPSTFVTVHMDGHPSAGGGNCGPDNWP
jgi:hypothetical protein